MYPCDRIDHVDHSFNVFNRQNLSEMFDLPAFHDLLLTGAGISWLNRCWGILADLARLGFTNVDLVFLDTDDIVLRYEAIKHNRLIYQTEDFARGTLHSKVIRQYLDFQPYLKVQCEAYKRRILSGQQRSHS